MDSQIKLKHIVETSEYVAKLGSALDTPNITFKKEVFELLSALCSYSQKGRARVFEILDYYKILKLERYRFKIVVKELETSDEICHKTAVLTFINRVIISSENIQQRIRTRNEFIGLGLLHILSNLRQTDESCNEVAVQLDIFNELKEADDAESLQTPNSINLNSHLDVFYAVLRQVSNTPQETTFLNILQHFLRIDSKEPVNNLIWDTAEKLVHRAALLEDSEDSARLLRGQVMPKFSCPNCDVNNFNRKQSIVSQIANSLHSSSPIPGGLPTSSNVSSICSSMAVPPPPPPPAMLNIGCKDRQNHQTSVSTSASEIKFEACNGNNAEESNPDKKRLLPQQETPAPTAKMKTINWNKIPAENVLGKWNIWTHLADEHKSKSITDLDWNEMENLFCLQPSINSPRLGREGSDTLDRKIKKESNEITILDGKRSLNINIFLKQFRSSNENIVQLIKNGENGQIGAEKLRGLLKVLPEIDEIEMLRAFQGDKNKLGNAEKFLLQLLKLPNYKLRIESMLLKEDFAASISYLEPSITSMLIAGEDLMKSKRFQEVLYMILLAGNFLNAGGYAGNAVGVKLSSLQKLTDVRANKPGLNLFHFVASQIEKKSSDLLNFPSELPSLENASKITAEQINNEIKALDVRIKKIETQVNQQSTDNDIKDQMLEFLQVAINEIKILQDGLKGVDAMRKKLEDFFCEDQNSFKLEECFKIVQNFCEKFKQAIKENERRRISEEQTELRRRQREEQIMRRVKQVAPDVSNSDPETTSDVKDSPKVARRNLDALGNKTFDNLFRRRSRILTDDEDGVLMDFLRITGNENPREGRASYGSLDRSWSRKIKTGISGKKRLDLLNINSGENRERSNSPSPSTESKLFHSDSSKPRISREWRQKIESWLQGNDNNNQNRRLLGSQKQSVESDQGSDWKRLDPLPEEKATNHLVSCNRIDLDRLLPNELTNDGLKDSSKEAYLFANHSSSKSTDNLHDPLKSCISPEVNMDGETNTQKPVDNIQYKPGTCFYASNELYRLSSLEKEMKIIANVEKSQSWLMSTDKSAEKSNLAVISPASPSSNFNKTVDLKAHIEVGLQVDKNEKEKDDMQMAKDNFDRNSVIRKTKRYKRPTDYNNETNENMHSSYKNNSGMSKNSNQEQITNDYFQHLSRDRRNSKEKGYGKNTRHKSSINREDVQEAIRHLKSPIRNVQTIWPSKKSIIQCKPTKASSLEVNDEGFEECQSFVSDTPSQEKEILPSINNPTNTFCKSGTSASIGNPTKLDFKKLKSTIVNASKESLHSNSKNNLTRSQSLKNASISKNIPPYQLLGKSVSYKPLQPRSHKSSIGERNVERSNSHNSLRGSRRSSISSTISMNTIRGEKMLPGKLSKTKAETVEFGVNSSSSKAPSYKSSPAKTTTTLDKNSESNSQHQLLFKKRSINSGIKYNTLGNTSSSKVSNFMRPTTSSTTKRHQDKKYMYQK